MTSCACRTSISGFELCVATVLSPLPRKTRKRVTRDECEATNQGESEGSVSVDLAALALDASSEIGGAGTALSRQDRAGGRRDDRCRRKLRPLHPQTGAAFEPGLCIRAFPQDG